MIRTIVQDDFEIDSRIPCDNAFFPCLQNSFFDGGYVVLRDRPSKNLILEFEVFSPGKGLHFDVHMPILTPSTCLLFVFVLDIRFSLDRFFIGNFRRFELDIDIESFLKPVGNDLNMELAVS